jgi:4-aminobutyrate aminotransferase
MLRGVRRITRENGIPLICDEVQSGMGRTGKWWAHEHSGIAPDIMSSAKALQVGAAIANKRKFGAEPGNLSSTWGGGSVIDLAVGMQTIRTIKKKKLLGNVKRMGGVLRRGLLELQEDHAIMENVRGMGLMLAFDLQSQRQKDSLILEMLNRGVVLLGTGKRGVRVIPPYVVGEREIYEFLGALDGALHTHTRGKVRHTGEIYEYIGCSTTHT